MTHLIISLKARFVGFVSILSLLALLGIYTPSLVSAAEPQPDVQNKVCKGVTSLKVTPTGDNCQSAEVSGSSKSVDNLLTTAINVFSVIVGIIAVIMIIYGGLRFITSGGDSGRITSARQTIIYAIIGLIIVAFAQFIARFVVAKAADTSNGS